MIGSLALRIHMGDGTARRQCVATIDEGERIGNESGQRWDILKLIGTLYGPPQWQVVRVSLDTLPDQPIIVEK